MQTKGLLVDLVPYGRRFEDREHDWLNSEMVHYWSMGGRWFVTRAGLEGERREDREQDHPRPRQRVRFGVQTKDGIPIGLIGVNRVAPHHRLAMFTAAIGEPAYWGGGYGTDALLLLIDYTFGWLDMRRVWIMTMSENPRVMRQMEKVGFTLEARQREATWVKNGWGDALIYGMFREEWPGREAMVERLDLRARAAGLQADRQKEE